MEITELIHDPSSSLPDFKPDLFIAGSGYESRSTCIPSRFKDPGIRNLVIAFKECQKVLYRKENDQYYTDREYEFMITSGDKAPAFEKVFENLESSTPKVMVDISVMPRHWYHSLLKYLHLSAPFKKVHLRIVYCPALFFEPAAYRRKIAFRWLNMNDAPYRKPGKEKDLFMLHGLGSEKGLGNLLFEKLKPNHIRLLYADPAIHKSYVETVFVGNHRLINQTDIRNLVPYPLMDTKTLYRTMLDHILPARNEHKVVIVPQGPKIFSMIAMILQLNYPDINIVYPHYISSHIIDKKPFSEQLLLDIVFEAD